MRLCIGSAWKHEQKSKNQPQRFSPTPEEQLSRDRKGYEISHRSKEIGAILSLDESCYQENKS